ncbi:hypothetical protein AB0S93_04250 [Acinetobacter baumannii]|uniref:hypothetical protein n=1 Tax=Acinetobacter baumannii TaxID=470 RepID=UPI00344BE4F7
MKPEQFIREFGVEKAIEAINEYYESDGMSGLYFSDLKEVLEGEQALKGEG